MRQRSLLLLVTLAIATLCVSAGAQILVVANASVAATSISKAELRDVFTGASSTLKNGAQITPVLLKQGVVHDEFLSLYIDKSDSGFRAGWRSILFSGQGMIPKTLDSEKAVLEYVARTPGAIGYIARATSHDAVKILVVR